MTIRAVLFDFGGVIVEGPFRNFSAVAERVGAPADAIRLINSQNPDANAWARAERGELDTDQFVAAFDSDAAALDIPLPAQEIIDVLAAMAATRDDASPAMLGAVAELRARGFPIALITNNVRPMSDDPGATWVYDEFDVVVESSIEGTRKPEEGIYRITLERLGVEASDAVMLDDLGINLKTARSLGMQTIKVTDPDAAAKELLALLDG